MADPYRNLTEAQKVMTPLARVLDGTYQMVPYDASTNKGLYQDGHRLLFDAMWADLAAVGQDCAAAAARADAAAMQAGSWLKETLGAVTRLSASTIQVAGVDVTARYISGRAISLTQTTSAFGYVKSSVFSGGNTTITVAGCIVDSGLTELFYGQDPKNAPKASSAGSKLYLAATYPSHTY